MQTVCAYLMAAEALTPEQALASLREKHRVACPNHGFLAQLALFHQMHCKCAPLSHAHHCEASSNHGCCMHALTPGWSLDGSRSLCCWSWV